jgi:hypothetical protein
MDIKKSSFDDVLIKSSHFSQEGKKILAKIK